MRQAHLQHLMVQLNKGVSDGSFHFFYVPAGKILLGLHDFPQVSTCVIGSLVSSVSVEHSKEQILSSDAVLHVISVAGMSRPAPSAETVNEGMVVALSPHSGTYTSLE